MTTDAWPSLYRDLTVTRFNFKIDDFDLKKNIASEILLIQAALILVLVVSVRDVIRDIMFHQLSSKNFVANRCQLKHYAQGIIL